MRESALGVAEPAGRVGFREAEGVRQSVAAQVTVAAKDFSTLGAVVGLDVRVRQQMRLQIGALVEGTAARRALVRRVVHMKNAVHGQSARLAEAFAAVLTLERLLLGVDVSAEQLLFSHDLIKASTHS